MELKSVASYQRLIGSKIKLEVKIGHPVVGKVLEVVDSDKGLARIQIEQNHYRTIRLGNLNRVPGPAVASVYLKNIIRIEVL
ncbi:MAG TPA: hypothetical protein VGE24_12715 [Emticicia sp.]